MLCVVRAGKKRGCPLKDNLFSIPVPVKIASSKKCR